MKITLLTTLAGPRGNAFPGTVLDVSKKEADDLIAAHAARRFDPKRDAKAPRGMLKAVPQRTPTIDDE